MVQQIPFPFRRSPGALQQLLGLSCCCCLAAGAAELDDGFYPRLRGTESEGAYFDGRRRRSSRHSGAQGRSVYLKQSATFLMHMQLLEVTNMLDSAETRHPSELYRVRHRCDTDPT